MLWNSWDLQVENMWTMDLGNWGYRLEKLCIIPWSIWRPIFTTTCSISSLMPTVAWFFCLQGTKTCQVISSNSEVVARINIWSCKPIKHRTIKAEQHGLRKARNLDKFEICGNADPKIFSPWLITDGSQLNFVVLLWINLGQHFSTSTIYIFSLPNSIYWNRISAFLELWLIITSYSPDSTYDFFLASILIAHYVFIFIILVKFLKRKITFSCLGCHRLMANQWIDYP